MFVYECKIFTVHLILMVLIFWFERFVLMMVFFCCLVESSRTFGSIQRFSMYVTGLQWMDLPSVCYSQVDVSIISFSVSLCIFGSRLWFGFCRGQWCWKDLLPRWVWTRRVYPHHCICVSYHVYAMLYCLSVNIFHFSYWPFEKLEPVQNGMDCQDADC